MDNWKDYVCFQPLRQKCIDDNKTYLLFYMIPKQNESNAQTLYIFKEYVKGSHITLTRDQVGDFVESIFSEFKSLNIKSDDDLQKAKSEVATKSKRGKPNTKVGKTWFYKGNSYADGPIFVCGNDKDNRYYVFKHPNYLDYGFNMTEDKEFYS